MTRLPAAVLGMLFLAHAAAAQFLQQGGKLAGTGAAGNAQQGQSVAISTDGSTAIVGGYQDGATGAAWVYTLSGGVWSQQGSRLVGTGVIGAAGQGQSVAISADGNTAIVGGNADDSNAGAAWVFTRSGGVWSQQGSKLVGAGAVGAARQGWSVALSADGNTALIGGYQDNSGAGAAWVYTRSGGVWSQQGSKLVGTGAVGGANQGWSVALSADGSTAVVGGYWDNATAGAAWVFIRSGTAWSQQGGKLVGSGVVNPAGVGARQGSAVALSADGNTALVGGYWDNWNTGATWVFARSGGSWMQQGSKLVGTGSNGRAYQGNSLGISADGTTAIVGASSGNLSVGTAWVFTRSGGTWSQQGGKLVGTDAVGLVVHQGSGVALSGDGNTAVVGGPGDNSNAGAAWIYTRSGGLWSPHGGKLVGTGAVGADGQGTSVAISADGSTAIVGAALDNANSGAAWVYTRSGGVWSQQGSKLAGTDAVGAAQQGQSVAISADGNTVLVGGPGDGSGAGGAAWVYTRSGGVWSQQSSKLVGSGSVGFAGQGYSVAISADGNTAVVGGHTDNGHYGAVWVFARSGGVWSQQGSKLAGTGAVGGAEQGTSVAISADGTTLIVGGYVDSQWAGAAWVFTRSSGVWSQQGSKLVGTGAVPGLPPGQGYSVAISADGNTAIVGGPTDGAGGATWVFTRSGGAWSQQGSKLVGADAALGSLGTAQQGYSVAISADGNTAIVGGNFDASSGCVCFPNYTATGIGAAWVFTRSGGVWSQLGSKLVGTGAVLPCQQGSSVAISADGTTAIVGGPTDNLNAGAAWVFVSTATRLAFVQQPTAATVGQPIAPAVTVQLQDAAGAPVAEAGVTITISLSSGAGTLGGTLSRVTDASGLATFGDLSVDRAGSKRLMAASAGRASAVSGQFTVLSQSFVLSDESGRLIEELVTAGYGGFNLYQVLVTIQGSTDPSVSGIITDELLSTLQRCPPSSQVFTTQLKSIPAGGSVATNDDCTMQLVDVRGAPYYTHQWVETLSAVISGVGTGLFTHSTDANIPLTTFDAGGRSYRVFAVAWALRRGTLRRVIPRQRGGS